MKHPFSPPARRLLLVLMLLAVPAADGARAHSDPTAERYQNGSFGFTLNLPGALLSDYQTVTSPEGITFTSPDGLAAVNVFGTWNEGGKPLAEIVEQYKRDVPDARFTYEWRGRNSAVLSGYQAGDIFYVRIAMSPDRNRVAVLNMIYAPELKQELDPVVTRLSTSLTIR